MWSIGLDVQSRSSAVCILDGHGKRVKELNVAGGLARVLEVVGRIRQPFAICYEASCGYGYVHDRLERIARRVVVAHPGQLRLIFRSKRKNDRVDARKLATLLFLDQVPPVHVPSMDVRAWRGLIEFRHRLVAKRVRAKNGLRSLLRGCGVELQPGKAQWTKKGMTHLATLELPAEAVALQRDLLLDEVRHLTEQLGRVERELNAIGHRHPGVMLLTTIPGVGPRTAEAMVAYVDRPGRFARNKAVGSYFGLIPCQDASAANNRLGHITREGPATVRKLVTEAAWQAIRRSPHVRGFFERICGEDPSRKKIALVATAHYLVRVMHAMLRTGEVWRHETKKRRAA